MAVSCHPLNHGYPNPLRALVATVRAGLLSYIKRGPLLWKKQRFVGRCAPYSTVTDLARFRGLSTSVPRTRAAW
jgi:hypothetical protein